MTYSEFCARKEVRHQDHGIARSKPLAGCLFDFQKTAVDYALRKGRCALFLDTGLGKTLCQLEWCRHVPGRKLILAPLAVAAQTVREGAEKLGMNILHSRDGTVGDDVTIANYERLHLFDPSQFDAVVLDESSILKSFAGKTKQALCDVFGRTKHRLACTATPAPNDHTELGNHSDFLGVMPQNQMLARWFINDSSDTGTWRLKGHAVDSFWKWVGSWAVCAERPSDLGGDDSRFALPPLSTRVSVVSDTRGPCIDSGFLFPVAGISATGMHSDKRATLKSRIELAAQLASSPDPVIVWCETNDESRLLAKLVPGCVEVTGSDDMDAKEEKLEAFSTGRVRAIVTKASIAGFGLNWQHCAHQVFSSVSYSYESFYQAVRRSWRFGQHRPVVVDVVISESEQGIWQAQKRKLQSHQEMKSGMQMAKLTSANLDPRHQESSVQTALPSWLVAA